MAHKKGQSSTRNGRDSNAQHRGIKHYGGELTRNTVALNITAVNWLKPVLFWSGNAEQNSNLAQMSDAARIIHCLLR